ncbi:hypothetical protein [Ciceribacter sp. L1K23]|uniref:hypothetical protein n=1 Tax=Ciceribacter sp. L1K23 TaxID=2820276 RepID=UPI001BA62D66|nr:hypothetical protein [Ciceribacter sp. L1K23]
MLSGTQRVVGAGQVDHEPSACGDYFLTIFNSGVPEECGRRPMEAGRFGSNEAAYEAAIRHCAGSILPMHLGEKLVNKIFGRSIQSHAAGLLAAMHCEAQIGMGDPPTLAVLQQKIGSPRTLASFFALLKLAGYIRAVPVEGDRRQKVLEPTHLLLDGLKTWLAHHLRCAEIAAVGLPAPGLADRLLSNADYGVRYVAGTRMLVARTREEMARDHAWAWFDRYDCGDRIALALARSHYDPVARDAREDWFPFEARSLASALGISHSHIRNVLNGAEARGYLSQDRGRGRLRLEQPFLDDMRTWHLTFWGWLAEVAHGAEQDPEAEGSR